jgi:hypothetical protein
MTSDPGAAGRRDEPEGQLTTPEPPERHPPTAMAGMIRMLWDGTDHYRSRYFATPVHRERVRAEHAEIMRAVASGDSATAAELSRRHRDHALQALCDALPAQDTEAVEPPDTTAKPARRASRH